MSEPSLKLKTARTLKWNAIDRIASQLLYAVVGIVLANVLSKEDFGLVGALLVFQAFAILFVDSGFGASLLRLKNPTQEDYSTVFWFNLSVSLIVYIILWFAAPLIADIFQGDQRLIPLSKVMFLSFIINGLAIVQTNRLMKNMDVKQIAVANTVGLIISGIVGVWLALAGYGAWALVWQTISLACVKTLWLWITSRWTPSFLFSMESMRKIWRVGISVFSSSLLNTICQNIYSFVIGAYYNLRELGVYTQADKWSKMGSASLSQIMTASFVPLMSKVQDNTADFKRYMKRINRMSAFITIPALTGMAIVGRPLFHTFFANKWDAAIPLFQILSLRGIFLVFLSLFNNYLLALGAAKKLVVTEIIKDGLIIAAIFATVYTGSITILVWGQFISSAITLLIVAIITSRTTNYSALEMIKDALPFVIITIVWSLISFPIVNIISIPIIQLIAQIAIVASGYILTTWILHLPELKESSEYLLGRFRKKNH